MEKELIEALQWYLEDDKRSVEMGILENIELRPAFAILKKYTAQPSVQADQCPRCNGRGWYTDGHDNTLKCPACNGTGIRR